MKCISMKPCLIIILAIISSLNALSQGSDKLTSKSKKARTAFEAAAIAYEKYQYELAMIHIEDALRADNKFIEAYMLLGDVYAETRQTEKALEAYKKAVAINPDFFPANFYNIGNFSLSLGLYAEALKSYKSYLNYPSLPTKHIGVMQINMEKAEFGLYAVSNPVPFNPQNLGDKINGPYDENVNAITADNSRLYFTLRRPKDEYTKNQKNEEEEDFFLSIKGDSGWEQARRLPPPLNTTGNEGAISVSPDGSFAIFTACHREDSYGGCDLYYTERRGNRWSMPVNLGENVNSRYWDTHASIASDGKTVYFVSKRQDSYGGGDIYKTVRLEDGSFSPAQNLGKPINTDKEEATPFIHPDNQTLYFSSNGHLGMGGYDFYRSVQNADGSWSKPENLGYPINTHLDELGLVISSDGSLAYISSNKKGGFGRYDIYSFELPPAMRSVSRVSYMKGIVYDSLSRKLLQARFELIDLSNGKTLINSVSDAATGDFLVCLPEGKNYGLNVQCEGYLFYSDYFAFAGLHSSLEPLIKNIPLLKIGVGEKVVLKNIFFDTDKYELKPESVAELLRLVNLLNKNQNLTIEIGGHTDNAGSDDYNRKLSENRAKAVVDFLISKGITSQRLKFKGYGETQPVDSNDNPEGRANNRRTEFKVISM